MGAGGRSACWGWGGGSELGQGTQAWACTLCSPDVGPFPARLPWPARHAAGGWCPPTTCPPNARGCHLPGLAQGTPGALLSPVPSPCSPLSSQPLSYLLALSLTPSSPTLLPLQTHTQGAQGAPCQPLAPATNSTAPREGAAAFSPAWGQAHLGSPAPVTWQLPFMPSPRPAQGGAART